MIALLVLGKHNQVPSALVGFLLFGEHATARAVHLASEDGLEDFLLGLSQLFLQCSHSSFIDIPLLALQFCQFLVQVGNLRLHGAVFLFDIVEEILYAHHIAMVGDGHASHTVGHGLVHELGHTGHSIEQ